VGKLLVLEFWLAIRNNNFLMGVLDVMSYAFSLILSVDLILARFIDPVIKVNLMNIVKSKFVIDSSNFYILICNYFNIT